MAKFIPSGQGCVMLCLNLLLMFHPVLGQQDTKTRQLQVDPLELIAGSIKTIHFTYTVGEKGIDRGGGIRFELPVAYGETEPLFFSKPQNESEEFLGYVSAHTSRGEQMKTRAYGISGGIFQCLLFDKPLSQGDQIMIEYTGVVQSLARKVEVRHGIRRSEKDEWERVADPPMFEILPRDAYTLILTSPADIVLEKPFDLSVVLLDKFGNLATGYRGTIQLSSTDSSALPTTFYTFREEDAGKHVFKNVMYSQAGFQKLSARDTSKNLQISTHYSLVSSEAPLYKRYFGDTHFHTGTGANHAGFFAPPDNVNVNTIPLEQFQQYNAGGDHRANFTNADDAYRYAREVVGLDFASSSEHDGILLDEHAWQESQDITSAWYQPGQFTTFYAYEWTPPFFHHIVLYKEAGLKVFHRQDFNSLPKLWQALEEQGAPAITIPHVSWQFEDHNIWDEINNTYRRLGEIYSLWNNRFLVLPDDMPQRFELGPENKWSYQYAWDKGHKIGVVGSTDNHLGRPGANNYTIYTHHTGGFAAVLAEANNREDLWQAMHARRTYATTGTRIYLDFRVDGHWMGTEYETDKAPTIAVKVAGTNKLRSVEVVKYENGGYSLLHKVEPEGETTAFTFQDSGFSGDCFYYLRVSQEPEYPGRPWSHSTSEMAWSSPVWVKKQ